MDWILENKEWLFSGLGGAILIFFLTKFFIEKNDKKGNNNVTINNNVSAFSSESTNSVAQNFIEKNKLKTCILFIDDQHKDYKMVSILQKAGWNNTKSIKDITDLDDPKVLEADIIFVDINGVGKKLFNDEGLGLASALKKKYPLKKIVLYSAENTGDRFHKAIRDVDDCLSKNAEPYQFINLVETLTNV